MDREEISRIAHTDHPVKAPLDDDSVREVLRHALPRGDERVLDLGCGPAEWLLRALAERPGVRAEGIDLDAGSLAEARERADAAGVGGRLALHHAAAEEFAPDKPFDAVFSVGAAHAFGGLLPTLAAAHRHLAPGGRVVVGDGYWEAEPTAEAVGTLGDFDDLATTLDKVAGAGWTPVAAHLSTRHELDAYEWSWLGSVADWALDRPEHPDSAGLLELVAARRDEWLRGYRHCFGFVSLVLRRTHEGP
ncbi:MULTISPECIES: cyclopropane-fatty-acyl-phospholipid synthase family protein [unclassified Streptomyces]|uniref:SAM-dependent methyltransferase n=1 Tax=unclassified Streptomyces TaxID=2593676 RepID=UPI00278C8A00|nr:MULTISPECIES: class I SAM-dependent methyltransferase [unclassified Streptomyces]